MNETHDQSSPRGERLSCASRQARRRPNELVKRVIPAHTWRCDAAGLSNLGRSHHAFDTPPQSRRTTHAPGRARLPGVEPPQEQERGVAHLPAIRQLNARVLPGARSAAPPAHVANRDRGRKRGRTAQAHDQVAARSARGTSPRARRSLGLRPGPARSPFSCLPNRAGRRARLRA